MIMLIVFGIFIIFIFGMNYAFTTLPLKKLISQLGGRINYQGQAVFPFQGRDITIQYFPGGRNRSPELRVSAMGDFGAEALIRYENSSDRFYKKIGLNHELEISDREINDELYFECDDQEFLNLFFQNFQTKSEVLNLLESYSDIEITKKKCLIKLYPAPYFSMLTKEDILKSTQDLIDLLNLVPSTGGNHPELGVFKVKRFILYFLGTVTLAAGIIFFVWASSQYRVVDAMRLWMLSFNYCGTIALTAGIFSFFIIKGFSTSSKVFIYFLLTFGIGALLCGRYGTAVYNGFYDKSSMKTFDQVILGKYTTSSKNGTTYHIEVQPWHEGMNNWHATVNPTTYSSVTPGSTMYRVLTKSGRLGFEWVAYEGIRYYEYRDFSNERPLPSEVNGIDLESDVEEIFINPMTDLNGMSRDSILNLRQSSIEQMPSFAPEGYQPDMKIFGQIQDGRPWWGMLGLCYYGPGLNSIKGPSRESQFITNPYLLLGVESPLAFIVKNYSLVPQIIYPAPNRLTWGKSGAWGRVIYNVHDYYNGAVRYEYSDIQALYLIDYNARDFGYRYFEIDSALSQNISGVTDTAIPIIQFIHTGRSCGYPGGCNNMSPHQPDLKVRWTDLPARIYIKLWKGPVNDVSEKSDMDYIIDLN